MNENVIKEAGLTDSETKIYLALLEIGDSTRGNIVNHSRVAGSKVYENLEKLHQKGLVSWYIQQGVKHFKPTNPKQLLTYLEEKKKSIIRVEEKMQSILPLLLSQYSDSKEEQEVELLTGMKGLETIFFEQVDLLKRGEFNYVIGGTKGSNEGPMFAFFEKIHHMRQAKGIKTKMLYNVSQKETVDRLYGQSKFSLTQVRYIPTASPVAINIYANRVVIIIFGKEMTLIHIRSQQTASSFLEYFSILWKQGNV